MGEREMMLVLGALMFFTVTSLSINRFCLTNSEFMMQTEFDYYAVSLAQGIIEEAKTRAFDVAVEGTPPPLSSLPGAFTYPPSPRWDEHYPNFSDVDDYHGLNLNINASVNGSLVSYNIRVVVGYVRETDLNTVVSYRTFHKKMTVTVTSTYLRAPVVLSHVFSYYQFD